MIRNFNSKGWRPGFLMQTSVHSHVFLLLGAYGAIIVFRFISKNLPVRPQGGDCPVSGFSADGLYSVSTM